MKIIITIIFLLFSVGAFSQVPKEIVWNELTKGKVVELTEMLDSSIQLLNYPFKTKFENKTVTKFTYEQDNKEISFIPYGIKLRDKKNTFIPAKKVLQKKNGKDEVSYNNILGSGISIINQVNNKGYRKLIRIDNTLNFANMLSKVDSMEIIFEISSLTFNSTEWDKQTTKYFTSQIALDSLNKIEAVSMWDSDTTIITTSKLYSENGKMYIAKIIPTSFLLESNKTVYTDITITFGNEYGAVSGATTFHVAKLTSSTAITSNDGQVRVATVSGTSISYGSSGYVTGGAGGGKICVLSSSLYTIVHRDYQNGYLRVHVGTITGTTPSEWTTTQINSDDVQVYGATYISNVNGYYFVGVIFGCNSSGLIKAIVLQINQYTGVVYYGSEYTIASNAYSSAFSTYSELPSTTKGIVIYRNASLYNAARVITFITNSTTVSIGSEYVVEATGVNYCGVVAGLTDTKAIVAYESNSGWYAKVATISGTTISFGSQSSQIRSSLLTTRFYFKRIDDSNAMLAYCTSTGKYKVLSAPSTTISLGTEQVFNNAGTSNVAIELLDSSVSFLWFTDSGNSNYATGIIGNIAADGKKINEITYPKWNNSTITKWNNQ